MCLFTWYAYENSSPWENAYCTCIWSTPFCRMMTSWHTTSFRVHDWPFVRGIRQYLYISSILRKGPVIRIFYVFVVSFSILLNKRFNYRWGETPRCSCDVSVIITVTSHEPHGVTGPLCGEFPSQRPVTRSFDVFFDLRLNKRLSKQSWGWCFDTPSRSLWRHCNAVQISNSIPKVIGQENCRLAVRFVYGVR